MQIGIALQRMTNGRHFSELKQKRITMSKNETKEVCRNCQQPMSGNYCSNCGQKRHKRIDGRHIWNEVQYTVIHTNKGFLYSIKNILINPGRTAREYVDGKRMNHYKPLLLLFVLSGFSTYLMIHVMDYIDLIKSSAHPILGENYTITIQLVKTISGYSSLLSLLALPFYSLITLLIFRKWQHNYYEHIVVNSYLMSFTTLVNIIVVIPIIWFFWADFQRVSFALSFSALLLPFLLVWFYHSFYIEQPLKKIIGKTLLILLFILILLVLIALIVALILGIILVANHHPV